MYEHALAFPASTLATFVAMLPPREACANVEVISLSKGEPSYQWDYFAMAVFMSIFMLGLICGIALCIPMQWIFVLVERSRCACADATDS